MELYETNNEYPFEDISLQTPQPLQGGTYLAKVVNNDDPIIFQTPKCRTKKGIHKTGKKTYCDLLFDLEQSEFVEWIYTLEQTIQELIFDKKEYWFVESDLTLDDIEYNWVNTIKKYKKLHMMRTFLSKSKGYGNSLQVYDHNQSLVSEEKVKSDSDLICIIEISGLKFSATSFHIEYNIKQIMILENKPKYQSCMIKIKKEKKVHYEDEEDKNDEDLEKTLDDQEKENDEEEEVGEDDKKSVVEQEVEEEVEHDDDKKDTEQEVEQDDDKKDTEQEVEQEVEQDDKNEVNENSDLEKEVNNKELTLEKDLKENEETDITDNTNSLEPNRNNNESENLDKLENPKQKDNMEEVNETLVKNNDLNEIVLDVPKNENETMSLRNPNEVYLDIYKAARQKAKEAKRQAIKAYLTVKKIKQQYLIDESEISEEESDDDFLFSEN